MRVILFDFGGTLDFPRHWLDRFLVHYRAAGIDIERPELDIAFSAATRTAYTCVTRLRNYSLCELVDFLLDLQFEHLQLQGMAVPSWSGASELKQQIRERFVAESAEGLARSRLLLASLAPHLKIGVVSNFYGNLDRVIAEADLAQMIAVTADSGLLGFHKPDSRIFLAPLAHLGVQPRETVMVGDSLRKDCAPARALGMKTIWLHYREPNVRTATSSDSADFTIESLEELNQFEWLAG